MRVGVDSYRFEDALFYLQNCIGHMNDADLPYGESDARIAVLKLCQQIVREYSKDGEEA